MSRSLTTTLFLMLLLAGKGLAQERDTTAARTQEPDTTAVPVATLRPLIVTVSRVALPANEVGFAYSLVTSEDLMIDRPLYSVDAVRKLQGTYIYESNGPGGPTILSLRGGEEVFTQILMDGVKVNQNGGFFDFQGLTLSNLDRIEVLRGPQSALYGSSAVSGVVQFITAPGTPGPARLGLVAEGGGATDNGGSFRAAAEVSGGTDWLLYSGSLGTAYSRGIYDVPNDAWTLEGSLRLDALLSEKWSLLGTFRQINVESNLPVRDPGATRVPLDPNARSERDRSVASLSAAFAATPKWLNTLRGSFYAENFVYEDQRDDVAETGDYPFSIFDADFTFDSDLRRYAVDYTGTYELLPAGADGNLTLSAGALWEHEELTDRTSGEFGEGEQELNRNSIAGFAEITTGVIPRSDLLIGARVEKYEGLSAEVTPRASLRVNAVRDLLDLRGAAARAYKAPNLQQQYLDNPFIASNPDLEAETSTSWEVGADLQLAGRSVTLGLTYFQQDFDNLIRTVAEEGTTRQINRNLGVSRARGLEWILQLRPAVAWLLGTEGAWVSSEVLDNTGLPEDEFPEGEALPFRPDVVANVFVEWAPNARLTTLARGGYVGAQTVLSERFSGERVELDPHFVILLRANYALSYRVQLYARVDNLFDTEYETAFDRAGIPFTIAAGAQVGTHSLLR